MKRCPECLFIYPESDELCDFDKTPLVVVNDAEIDAVTKPRKRSLFPIIGVAAVAFAVIICVLYFSFARSRQQNVQASTEIPVTAAPEATPETLPSPSPSPSASPSPSSSPTPKSSPNVATSHSRTSVDPVSTSGPGMGSRRGGKPVIILASGAKIDADEVWRTRDGFWYRKNGIVTLLKHSQVKSIASR